jgi:hypothetical protein
MVNRTVATKLTEEEHSKLIDFCNDMGCTPSSLIKKVILEKISQKEGIKETETNKPKKSFDQEVKEKTNEELLRYLGLKK